ncbi:MAG: RNase adapter RapZ [Actinomycetia bacterium]|nr:RNase adapter RapZ [Actinomycetes bacterium]
MSGAGRSTAAKCLEDLGWFVVDNLPPGLLPPMIELAGHTHGSVPRIAVVIDVRSRSFSTDLEAALGQLTAAAVDPRIVFLEASDSALVRRFENVRRMHPLQGDGRIVDGIAKERVLLGDLRAAADLVIDTSDLNVHQLRAKIEQAFEDGGRPALHATVVSFGFKYGLPVDADLVIDVRFLPNPHWVPELRPQTGLDPAVAEHVLGNPDAQELLSRYESVLRLVAPGYLREGKRYLTLAVGCTGGKHRSVALAEEVGRRLRASGVATQVVHRDLGRE